MSMFDGNEVTQFLYLQEKIEKLKAKSTTVKNQHRLSCLINKKEKIKERLNEFGTLAEQKSIFPVLDLARILTVSLTIVEGKNYHLKQENGNFYILEDQTKPVITLSSDKICNGQYQIYTFQGQKLQEDSIHVLESQLNLSNYEYLYFLLNELIGKKIELHKEALDRRELVFCMSQFFLQNLDYIKEEAMIQTFKKKEK